MDNTTGGRAGPPAQRWVCLTCALLLLGFASVWQVRLGTQYALDYDEGVFLCSTRAALSGQPLFAAVFSSQPPAFLTLLKLACKLFGDSVLVGREVSVFFALMSLSAVGWIAWRLAGPLAAPSAMLALGLASLFFKEARIVQAEMPALAWSLLALGALFARPGRRAALMLMGAGACLALGVLTKLLVAPMLCPALLLVVVGPEFNARRRFRSDPHALTLPYRFFVFGAACAVVCLLGILPWDRVALYDQAIRFHTEMRRAFPLNLSANLRQVWLLLQLGAGTTLLAVTGLIGLARKKVLAAGWLVLWLSTVGLFLVMHAPLYQHHLALLLPPLAVAASANVLWLTALRSKAAQAVLLGALCLLSTVAYLPADTGEQGRLDWLPHLAAQSLAEEAQAEAPEQEVLQLIEQYTRPGEFVVSDQQMQVFRAGRQPPPQLCDTSLARISSGYLTDEQAIRASADSRMIIFWTDRLARLPAYRQWVQTHFRLLKKFAAPPAALKEIYLKD